LKPYAGKQFWIWQLSQCGTPDIVVEIAKSLGCSGIIVKAWDGADSADWLPQLQQIVPIAHEAGLLVGAWGYSYGSDIAGEVAAMENAIARGADWLIIDAEVEYEVSTGAAMAEDLFAALTASKIAYAGFAYTSFAFPQLHPDFPWEMFSKHCYAVLPQVYFGDLELAPDIAVQKSIAQYAQYGLPAAPIGQAYGAVTGAQDYTFGKAAYRLGCPGVSFWSFQHATMSMFEGIKEI
jgi:hypothetical protein